MKKRLIKWVSIGLVIAIVASGGYFGGAAISASRAAPTLEAQTIQSSFLSQNPGMTIQQQGTQTKVYVIAWKDAQNQGVSVLLGGIWTKIYSEPIPATTTGQPTPTPAPTPTP